MPDYVYISYSRSDRSYVDILVRRLADEAIPYWIDHEMDYGDEWAATIDERLAGAAVVLVVVTPRAVASSRVEHEVSRARAADIPIVPLVRRRARARWLEGLVQEDVTGGRLPAPEFYDRIRRHLGSARGSTRSRVPESWEPRVRLPHRLGPLVRTPAETGGVGALLAATVFLGVAGVSGGNWNVFLVFPAFGIPDLLFAWFRWRRFRLPGRWSTDVRAAILLTVLTAYLTVSAIEKFAGSGNVLRWVGLSGGTLLGWAAVAVWVVQVVRDRPRRRPFP